MAGGRTQQIGLIRPATAPSGTSDAMTPPASANDCLSDEQLLAFVEGCFGSRAVAVIDEHLGNCLDCGALVVEALHACGLVRSAAASLSSPVWALDAGTCIGGRYTIRRPLARGGMGDVFEAFDLDLQRTVALKTPRATECDNPEIARRIKMEARLARSVRHPNVCRVRDVGLHRVTSPSSGRVSFVSMDLIQGESLAARLRRGPLSLDRARVVGCELLAGMAAIHSAGVIHRDIKSHNVMLSQGAGHSVVIIDFGLAIEMRPEGARPPPVHGSGQRSIEGSLAYMAPEQLSGGPVAPTADIFAAGVVIFHALTGALPFRAFAAHRSTARRDANEVALRARWLAPHVPARVDAFIARCLDLDPQRRYSSASHALGEFESALSSAGPGGVGTSSF